MKRVHYTDNYLMSPQHPVTVNLIGAGGTGSQVLTCLARLDAALRGLGHPGLFVTLYDPDIVTEANIGRQLFGPSDWLYSRFFICFRHYQAFPFPLHFLSCQRLRH